jgi:hypothetical protein
MAATKKDEGVDIALVLGGGAGPKGGKPPPKKASPMLDDPTVDENGEGSDADALPPGFSDAAEEYLDAALPMEQRVQALKTAIHLCREADY